MDINANMQTSLGTTEHEKMSSMAKISRSAKVNIANELSTWTVTGFYWVLLIKSVVWGAVLVI